MELLRAPLWGIRQIIPSANKKQVIEADQSEGSFTSHQRRTKPPRACTNDLENVFYSLLPYPRAPCTASEKFCAPLGQACEDSVRRCGRRSRIHVSSCQTLSTHLYFADFFNVPCAHNNGTRRFRHLLSTAHQEGEPKMGRGFRALVLIFKILPNG